MSRRATRTLSCPACAGFRERRTAPFRVRAKHSSDCPRINTNSHESEGNSCEDSWTTYQSLSPSGPLPQGGLRPRPRKPPAPRAAGHERALRATRNPPRLPSSHEIAPPHPRSSSFPQRRFIPNPFYPVHELTQIFTNTKIRVIRVGNILRVPDNRIKFGVEVCHVLEYDTEQQVTGNHLLCAWETFENLHEPSREAHARTRV